MKKFKNILILLTAVWAVLLLPQAGLRASAADPVTYAVKYIPDVGEWRYQANTSTFDESLTYRELYYMFQDMKEGDIVVVYNDSDSATNLDLGSLRLSNLTIARTASFTIVFSGEVTECHVLAGTSCSVNANVANAHVFDSAVCNFNGNVQTLTIHANDEISSTVGCTGTVGHLYAPSDTLPRTFYDLYQFPTNTLNIQEGVLMTHPDLYRTSPGQTTAPTTPAQTTPPAETPPSSGSDDDEYDEVPKTGSLNPVLWLLCLGGICGVASFGLKKSKA